jgi:sec-independent protein translocase protein TatC
MTTAEAIEGITSAGTSGFLRRTRPFAIVIILCLAALIAPTPDPVTFLSLGVPMCLLYEGCIWLGVCRT